ncbi:MAG: SMC family ATPase [Deltaproteobacteria bacterium]|nr:MAG: SMC family ATPase [Deltaproteobacteria bacterium]
MPGVCEGPVGGVDRGHQKGGNVNIRRIHLQNFRLHADTEVFVPAKGVTAIVGGNETGKTTILEGLEWAFSGGDHTRGKVANLRWFGAPPRSGAKVTVDFSVGGKEYRVERLESTARLFAMPAETVIAQGTTPVSEAVTELIGMTHREFISTVFCRQKDVEALSRMGATDRVAFIRQVLQMEKIDEALKNLRKRKNEMAARLEGMTGSEDDLKRAEAEQREVTARVEASGAAVHAVGKELQSLSEHMSDATKVLAEERQKKGTFRDLTHRLEMAKRVREGIRSQFADLEQQIAAGKEAEAALEDAAPEGLIEELRDYLHECRRNRQRLQQALDAMSRASAARNGAVLNLKEHESRVEELQCALDAVEYDPDLLAKLDAQIQEMSRAHSETVGALRGEIEAHRTDERKTLRKIEAIKQAGEGACCPTCLRGMDGEVFDQVLESLNDHLRVVVKDAEHKEELVRQSNEMTRRGLAELRAARSDAEQARDAHKSVSSDLIHWRREVKVAEARLEEAASRRNEARADLAKIEKLDVPEAEELRSMEQELDAKVAERVRLESRVEALAVASARLERLQADHDARTVEVEALTSKIASIGFDEERYLQAEESVGGLQEKTNQAEVALSARRATYGAQKDELSRVTVRVESLREVVSSLEAQKAEYRTVTKATEMMEGFRVAVTSTIRPEMEELMSGFYAALTDGRHEAVELNEDFSAQAFEAGHAPDTLSGGASDQLALAQRLALSLMMAQRSGNPMNLLFLDEPFGSLEESRRMNVLNLIRDLSGVFTQVVVISHVAETKDAADYVVELEHDPSIGASRVVAA